MAITTVIKEKMLRRTPILLFIAAVIFSLISWVAIKKVNTNPNHRVGDRLDSLNGVVVYYNGAVDHVLERNTSNDGYNLGLKYQCVEFVKRYYYEFYKHKMPDSWGHAVSFFNPQLKDGNNNTQRNLTQYTNPSFTKPKVGDLIVMDGTTFNPYGHVCIVSKVLKGEIEIIQQNPGPYTSSREKIDFGFIEGRYQIRHPLILGWLRKN